MTTGSAQLHVVGSDPAPDCPYVGLVPFREQEAAFFFGRERDVEIITANATAARLTLLYAPSGVGKSSVLQAAVVPALRAADDDLGDEEGVAHTTAAVAYVSNWTGNPLEAVGTAIRAAIAASLGREEVPSSSSSSRFGVDWLRQILDDSGVAILYLVLDQFEEYFFYHSPGSSDDSLTEELGDLLTSRTVNAHVLLSIREDALAALDRFKGRVPHLFGNYLRLAQLDRDAARAAIEGPVREYNARVDPDRAMAVDPLLVDDLLDQVRAGRVAVDADRPQGGVSDLEHTDLIEAPYLQLVLTRVWEQERQEGSRTLRRETLAALGGAQTIVQRHLDDVVASLAPAQVPVAAAVFQHLVTASGSKIALAAMDLAAWSGQPVEDVRGLLESLSAGPKRILRPVPPGHGSSGPTRYEIFHDVMGGAVLEWRRTYVAALRERETNERLVAEREEARQQASDARRQLRTTWVSVAMVVVLLLAGALAYLNVRADHRAQQQARLAEAAATLGQNPRASLASAVAALGYGDDAQSRSAVLEAAAAPHDTVVAGPDPADGGTTLMALKPTPARDRAVAWDRAGRIIVVGRDGSRQADVRLAGVTRPVRDVTPAPDGSHVVVSTDGGGVWLVDLPSGRQTLLPVGRPAAPGVQWFGSGPASRVFVLGASSLTVLDPATGSVVATVRDDHPIYWALGLDDGRHVVTSDTDARMRVWDAATGSRVAESDPMVDAPGYLTQAGRKIIGVTLPLYPSDTQEVASWDWQAGAPVVRREFGAQNGVQSVAVNPVSGTVLVAFDKSVQEYDLDAGTLLRVMPQQPDWVYVVTTSADGGWVLTAGGDGRVLVWNQQGRAYPVQPTYELVGNGGRVTNATFLGDGVLSLEATGTLRWWPLPRPPRFTASANWVLDVVASGDGHRLATASWSGYGAVLDTADVTKVVASFGDDEPLSRVRFDPTDAHRVFTLGTEATRPRLWQWRDDARAATQGTTFDAANLGGYDRLSQMAVSPDGATVATGDSDGGLHFWDAHTGHLLPGREQPGNGYGVGGLAYDRTGRLVVTTRQGIRVIDPNGSERLLPLADTVDVAVDPTGRRIAAIAEGGTVAVWTQGTDQPQTFVAHGHRLGNVAFNRDGTRVAVGTAEGLVEVWDVDSGVALTLTRQHGDAVNSVLFAPDDDNRIISASDDTTVAEWSCDACADPDRAIREATARVQGR